MKTRWWCRKCEAELTQTDVEARECTQCHTKLPKVKIKLEKKNEVRTKEPQGPSRHV